MIGPGPGAVMPHVASVAYRNWPVNCFRGARRVRAVIFWGLREHNGEVVGDAARPVIIDRATHDRLVGLLDDPCRRRENFGRPRVHPLVGLAYCASCGGRMKRRSHRGRDAVTAAARTRSPSAQEVCASWPSRWRRVWRAT